jgi:oligopeptide transport system substrate-binding protein
MRTLRLPLLPGDLPTLDPQRAEDWAGALVSEALAVGLVRLDEQTGQVLPAMAESWSIGEDAREINFFLHENIPWVAYKRSPGGSGAVEPVRDCDGNVRMVTAVDWKLGLLRLLQPSTNSPNAAAFAGVIKNGAAYQAGAINNPTIVGIEAVDRYELKLTFVNPGVAGLAALNQWYVRPTPFWLTDGDQCTPRLRELWWQSDVYPSYGPFAIKAYSKNAMLTLVKNPHWRGLTFAPAAQIDEIRFNAAAPGNLLPSYDAGGLDLLYFPPGADLEGLANPRYRDQIRPLSNRSTQVLAFRALRPPTDDARVRLALSLAIDRDQLARRLNPAGQAVFAWQPARWLTPPGINATPGVVYSSEASVAANPQRAKELLWKYLYEKGFTGGAPPGGIPSSWLNLAMLYPAGARNQRLAEALQAMWKEQLGVPVQLVSRAALDFQKEQGLGWYPIVLSELSSPVPDAHFYLGLPFMPGGTMWNLTGWQEGYSYGLYRQAADAALTELYWRQRQQYYAQVEKILIGEEAVVAPLFWSHSAVLVQPGVKIAPSATGLLHFEFWSVPAR